MLNFIKKDVETKTVELTDEQLSAVTGGHAVKHSSKHSKASKHSKHSKASKHSK